jgi:hypothetical protein
MKVSKLTWGIAIALAGAVALTSFAMLRPRREVEAPPSLGRPADQRMSDASCLVDELASRAAHLAPESKVAAPATAAVRLRGRVLLPWPEKKKSEYSYAIYLFTPEGKVEGPATFVNTDRFELPSVSPGRRAVLFCPVLENLTFASQVILVPEQGDVDVTLKPQLTYLLAGRVVDANGAGVGGIFVTMHEPLTLSAELYLGGKPASAATVERTMSSAPGVQEVSPMTILIDPLKGDITRSVTADSRGRFALPLASPTDPVSLSLGRSKTEFIKEETVLPGPDGVRIVVPNQ